MKKIVLLLSILCIPSAFAQNFMELAGLNPATKYLHFETAHFEFTYQDGYLNFAKEAAKHIEHAHEIIAPILQWQPREKIHVLIADNDDSANGFAMPALRVGIVLIATPPDQWLSTSYTDNWIKLLVFHEYTHILNIDATTKWMEIVRKIFGDVIRPNGTWPSWMLEGLAVYFETRTSILGRGRSPYYDAIIRSYFNDGKLGTTEHHGITYGSLSGDWPYFPGGETAYAFGYNMWNQFGKSTKNDQKMGDYSINSSHRVPFFIDGNLEEVTGKQWSDYWDSFVQESRTRYQAQIQKIKDAGETAYNKVTNSDYSATGGIISPDGRWFAYTETKLDQRQGLILENFKTGKAEKIKDKLAGASMTFTPDSKKLIFSSLGRNTTFTTFSDLWAYDLEQKTFTQLTKGLRAKDPHLSPDGKMLAFTVTDHGTQILKIADLIVDQNETRLTDIQAVYQPKEFSMIGTPHWMNNSDIVFSLQELNQTESKIIQIAATPLAKPVVLVENGKMNRFPFACKDQLYYVSDQNGIDNVYTNSNALTNVITAAQYPFCSLNGELYASLLSSDGFQIVRFAPTPNTINPKEKLATPDAPESIPAAIHSPEIKIGNSVNYSPWRTLAPRQWAPFGYIDFNGNSGVSFGGLALGFDDTGKHQYLGTFEYKFKSATLDQSLQYTYYGFRPALTLSESSSTSDIAADDLESHYKRTHQLRLQADHLTQWTWSSLQVSANAFVDWNSYNNIFTGNRVSSADPEYNHAYIPGGGIGASFSDAIHSKLGFMAEGGSTVTAATQARVYQNDFTLLKWMTEYSRYVGLGSHHVLNPKMRYIGSSHPYGYDRSFAQLKGKNTTNIFDDANGFSLNSLQIRGYSNRTVYTKQTLQGAVDYHFPMDAIFNGSGPLFFNQVHGFVFGETTYILRSRNPNVFLPSFGLGLTADTTLFWHVPFSISAQMQYGTNKDFGGDQLFFLSLSGSLI